MICKNFTWLIAFVCMVVSNNMYAVNLKTVSELSYKHGECLIPSPANSKQAFSIARKKLSFKRCQVEFGYIFDQLLEITSEDPGVHNLHYFADFIVWNKNRGIISKRQASKLFNSYFGDVFIGLPETVNICSILMNNNILPNILNKELKQKKRGYVDILGKHERYNKIYQDYKELTFVLNMTKTACNS